MSTLQPETQPLTTTAPTITRELDELEEQEPGSVAHIVKVGPGETATAKVLDARVNGTPIEALCGHIWVPSRDPRQLPVCQACKEVYEIYRGFNEGLNDSPDD
jgi:hypothetical protein